MFSVFQVFDIRFDVILVIKDVSSLEIQWNLVNTDTDGHAIVSILSGLILEKIQELFLVGTNETLRFIWVSGEQVPTIVKFFAYIVAYL